MTPARRREGLGRPRPWATLAAAQPVRPLAADGAARVVAVVGTGRSGSTLLAFLLNAHPAIATVGELTGPPPGASAERSRCSCGRTLAVCPVWSRLPRDLRFEVPGRRLLVRSLRWHAADRIRDRVVLRMPDAGDQLRAIAARNVAAVEAVLALTGRSVLADASKDPVRVGWLARLTDLDLRVVHLVRDPLGYAGSRLRRGVPVQRSVRAWLRMAGHVRRLLRRFPPERTLRIRYEDLCTDTVGQLDRIAVLAGVSRFDPARVATFADAEHHVVGNRMRLNRDAAVTLDETWRDHLTPGDVALVLRSTAPQRRALGYA